MVAVQGSILGICKIFIDDLDVAKIYQWRWLEKSGQMLDNVDRIHQVQVIQS